MEKKTLSIIPVTLKGGPSKGLTLQYILQYDTHNRRYITVQGPWANWSDKPWNPTRLKNILLELMRRSDIPTTMSESQFLNLEWKKFNKVKIIDTLL